ncbi:unnamed protein product [Sphagnum balticum]
MVRIVAGDTGSIGRADQAIVELARGAGVAGRVDVGETVRVAYLSNGTVEPGVIIAVNRITPSCYWVEHSKVNRTATVNTCPISLAGVTVVGCGDAADAEFLSRICGVAWGTGVVAEVLTGQVVGGGVITLFEFERHGSEFKVVVWIGTCD